MYDEDNDVYRLITEISDNKFFQIKELRGFYKADHQKKQILAYDSVYGSCKGLVRGLYGSLEAGRWKIL